MRWRTTMAVTTASIANRHLALLLTVLYHVDHDYITSDLTVTTDVLRVQSGGTSLGGSSPP